jgi:hypothetical protein
MDNNTGEEQLTADFDESYQALVTAKDALLESYDPDDIDDAITVLNEVIVSILLDSCFSFCFLSSFPRLLLSPPPKR